MNLLEASSIEHLCPATMRIDIQVEKKKRVYLQAMVLNIIIQKVDDIHF